MLNLGDAVYEAEMRRQAATHIERGRLVQEARGRQGRMRNASLTAALQGLLAHAGKWLEAWGCWLQAHSGAVGAGSSTR